MELSLYTVRTFRGHDDSVQEMASSKTTQNSSWVLYRLDVLMTLRIIRTSNNNTIRIWDIQTGIKGWYDQDIRGCRDEGAYRMSVASHRLCWFHVVFTRWQKVRLPIRLQTVSLLPPLRETWSFISGVSDVLHFDNTYHGASLINFIGIPCCNWSFSG